MKIDLGYLGPVDLYDFEEPFDCEEFVVFTDGYTGSGIRVHGVIPKEGCRITFPATWRGAILINLEDFSESNHS